MKPVQNRTARDIQDRLGSEFTVLEFETPTRSANEAALAIGCTVDHIAKSLVFCTDDGEPVLVIVSGASRVDERKVSAQLGKAIHRADAQFVRDKTGFSIGGCHARTQDTASRHD
jgi:prolyl-tRNA editing enzyme YbaK/EbsC (Cys-tRNA(Pro) deacylase)